MKIISGGQTGVDRAALDFAIRNSIPHGGWCPCGRLAEDGRIPDLYRLRETPSQDAAQRTQWNVRDSDATVIFCAHRRLSGGTALTAKWAKTYQKPLLILSRNTDRLFGTQKLRAFLRLNGPATVNIAGPRESEQPGLGDFVGEILEGWAKIQGD